MEARIGTTLQGIGEVRGLVGTQTSERLWKIVPLNNWTILFDAECSVLYRFLHRIGLDKI